MSKVELCGRRCGRAASVGLFLALMTVIVWTVSEVSGAPGDLDTSFNGTGKMVATAGGTSSDAGYALAVQPDGKVLVAGVSNWGSSDAVLCRLNPEGNLDATFNGSGKLTMDFSQQSNYARAMVRQSDGKVLVAGPASNGSNTDFSVARYNADGTLDSTFSADGKVMTPIGPGDDSPFSLVVQADGKIVVVGQSYNGANYEFALVRYNPDGSLNATFGEDGKVTTDVCGSHDNGRGVALQSDGKIVLAGSSQNGSTRDFTLVRYTTDGELDVTFNSTGKVVTSVSTGNDSANDLKIQTDGKILVAGYASGDVAVARYNSDGTLDPTFNGCGVVTTSVGTGNAAAQSLALDGEGKILVVGGCTNSEDYNVAMVRYLPDGSLDPSLNGTGSLVTTMGGDAAYGYAVGIQADGKALVTGYCTRDTNDNEIFVSRCNPDGSIDQSWNGIGTNVFGFGGGEDNARDVTVQADGKILLVGSAYSGWKYNFVVMRYREDGSLDAGFGSSGVVTTPVRSSTDCAMAVAVQPDGRIIVTGDSWTPAHYDFAVARYDADGNLDPSFNGTGKVVTPMGGGNDNVHCMCLQTDGKILVGGSAHNGSNYDFAVARYNADGSLDTDFNGTGKVLTPIGTGDDHGRGIAVQSDGKIVMCGVTGSGTQASVAIARYNPDGTLDSSLNGTGKIAGPEGFAGDVAVQSDGKILIAGNVTVGMVGNLHITRYNGDGGLDATFGNSGRAIVHVGGGSDTGNAMSLQPDGKILVAGHSWVTNNRDLSVIRCNADGSLDASFGGDGKVSTPVGNETDWGFGVALQSDGKIVVGGQTWNGHDYDMVLVRYEGDPPEIVVEQPTGTALQDGASSVDFGHAVPGAQARRSFTIRNTSWPDLTGLGITIEGPDAADFSVTASPGAPVRGPAGSTTFEITFSPITCGAKQASLHIASKDPDESPFDIALTGIGVTALENWRLCHFGTVGNSGDAADQADCDCDGVANLAEFAFGLNPGAADAELIPAITRVGETLTGGFTQGSAVADVTYGAEWSENLVDWQTSGIEHNVAGGTHTFSVSVAGHARRFLRLRVTTP